MTMESGSLEAAPAVRRRRLAVATPYMHRLEFRHFILFTVLPPLVTIGALVVAVFIPVDSTAVTLFFVMLLLTGFGTSVGYHRLFTHCSFETVKPIRVLLAVLPSMAGQGPLITWVAVHRRHHEFADKEGDLHSPNLHGSSLRGRIRGFIHSQWLWTRRHDYPNLAYYARDLITDRTIVKISSHYFTWVLLGFAIPTLIGGIANRSWQGALNGFLWGGVVRLFVLAQLVAFINSICHLAGRKSFRLRDANDGSRNVWILGLLVWGEGWHHNHHAFPYSAWFGLSWYRVDLGYAFIRTLQIVGLAWNVKVPTREQITAKSVPTVALL